MVDRVVGGAPQVLHGIGPPRTPPQGVADETGGRRAGRASRPHAGHPCRRPERHRGRRGRAWRSSRPSTVRCRGWRRVPSRARSQSAPTPRWTRPDGQRPDQIGEAPLPGHREAQRGGIDVSELVDRREQVGEPTIGVVDRRAVSGHQSGRVGAGRRRGHLLAEDRRGPPVRPRRRCRACDGPAPWPPGAGGQGPPTAWRSTASGSASRSSSRRQRAMAVGRSRMSSRASWQSTWSGVGRRDTTLVPAGRRSVRR